MTYSSFEGLYVLDPIACLAAVWGSVMRGYKLVLNDIEADVKAPRFSYFPGRCSEGLFAFFDAEQPGATDYSMILNRGMMMDPDPNSDLSSSTITDH